MIVMNKIKFQILIIALFLFPFFRHHASAQDSSVMAENPAATYRRKLMEKYQRPLEDFWEDLEPFPSRGRYFGEYRIKEMEEEVTQRPAYIPFEWAFRDEMSKDEMVISSRDAFLSEHGKLGEMKKELLRDKEMLREKTGSHLAVLPRRKLQEYLSGRILRFWRLDDETRLEELIGYQELREDLYDQGQDETPEEFEERRMKDKQRLLQYQPLKHFKVRSVRELMDHRAKMLQKKWRERSSAFSRID